MTPSNRCVLCFIPASHSADKTTLWGKQVDVIDIWHIIGWHKTQTEVHIGKLNAFHMWTCYLLLFAAREVQRWVADLLAVSGSKGTAVGSPAVSRQTNSGKGASRRSPPGDLRHQCRLGPGAQVEMRELWLLRSIMLMYVN